VSLLFLLTKHLFFVSGVALASTLQMSPEAMATCWEAFSLTKQVSELTSHTFEAYKTQVYKHSGMIPLSSTSDGAIQSRNMKRQASMVTPPTAKRQATPNAKGSSSSVDSVAIKNSDSPTTSARPAAPLPKYDERAKVGQLVASFNPKDWPAIVATSSPIDHRCFVRTDKFDNSNVAEPYRHMFTAISDRAQALENHLQKMGKNIIEKYGISDGENGIAPLEQVNIPRQETVCCVGRICNEVRGCAEIPISTHGVVT
jgi:DNA polymerase alpha subunit B N-terminal